MEGRGRERGEGGEREGMEPGGRGRERGGRGGREREEVEIGEGGER